MYCHGLLEVAAVGQRGDRWHKVVENFTEDQLCSWVANMKRLSLETMLRGASCLLTNLPEAFG